MKQILFSLIVVSFLLGCGSSKKVAEKEPTISKKSFAYIELFHEGIRYKAKGQYEEAISYLNNCLAIRTDDDAVYYALSQIYLNKNAFALSAEAIKMAYKIDPSNIWYLQELAYMNFETKKFNEATKNFEELVQREPRNVDWLYGYSECLVRIGKPKDAIKALDRTEEQIGLHPDLSIKKFNLYVETKQLEKGINELNKAREQYPDYPQLLAVLVDYYFQNNQEDKAIEMLTQLAKVDPGKGRVHLGLADFYRKQGKKQEAYTELELAFACKDVDLDTKMKILISIHEESINIDPRVYALVDIVVQQHPKDSKAHSIHGDYLLRAEKDEEALEAYKEALKYTNNQYAIWNQVLLMEYKRRKFEELYNDSKKCLEYFPSIPAVYLFNGLSANQLNKHQEAVNILELGKEYVVNDKPLEAEILSQLGEAYFGVNDPKKGSKFYELSLGLDPNNTLNLNNFAYRLALANYDLDRAEGLIERANNLTPNEAQFIDTYGLVMFKKESYTKAMTFFKQAYDIDPNDPIIIDHLGDAYFKIGEIAKAIEFWTKAKESGSINKNISLKIENKKYYDAIY
jgi:tetratricopeptide (TPR) repeat protein